MFDVGGVLGGVIGSSAVVEGDGESVLSSVIFSGPSPDDVPEDPERYVESRATPARPTRAAVKCDWCECRGEGPFCDWATTSLPEGGLPSLLFRDFAGDSDRSSKEPDI